MSETLELTLKKQWFDMVASGEKKEEYRNHSKWIMSRLENKTYKAVRFRNGYNADSPVCIVEYLGWTLGFGNPKWGGGSTPGRPLIVIKLGRVLHQTTQNNQTRAKSSARRLSGHSGKGKQ